jgi:SAM-dependent methyltransferase
VARLQDDWPQEIGEPIDAVVSMSAIHHLESPEKQQLFARIFTSLAPGGMFINGDEVRPADDAEYLAQMSRWAAHMHHIINAGLVPTEFQPALIKWEARNVTEFGKPKQSGDDCHDLIDRQLTWLTACGFANCRTVWQRELWAVMVGERPSVG